MKVALLKGQSQYGVLRLMIDEVARAFRRRGAEVLVADLERMQGLPVGELGRQLTAHGPLDLVYSINIGGNLVDRSGRPLIEVFGAPHVLQYVDYPLHDLNRLLTASPATGLMLVDPSHVRTVRKLLGPERFAHLGFGPHAALGSPKQLPGRVETFVERRPIPVLFTGTCYGPDKRIWNAYPEHVRKVFLTAVDIATSAEWVSPLDALDHALAVHGLDPNGETLPGVNREDLLGVRLLAAQVQEWVRTERRQQFFAAAARAGLHLTAVGGGYGESELCGNIDYRGSVAVGEAIRLMQNARLVINLNGNFGRGTHERVFTAMAAGAAVASDHSTYYAEALEPGRDIALFRWSRLDADMAELAEFVEDPKALFEMAQAGQARTLAGHCWDHRIDGVLSAAAAVREKYPAHCAGGPAHPADGAPLGA